MARKSAAAIFTMATMTAWWGLAGAATVPEGLRRTSMVNSGRHSLLFALLLTVAVLPASVRAQAVTLPAQLLPSCPSAGSGCEFDPINRFKCGRLFLCTYDTLCAVQNAGFNQNTDCCQAPTNTACTLTYDPQICGSKECPYLNLCLAKAAGFTDAQCNPPTPCTLDIKVCPTGEVYRRSPLLDCSFPPCPGQTCTLDVLRCPNGEYVSRNPENGCRFDPCTTACTSDIKECPPPYKDVFVSRDPENDCEFYPCPVVCTLDTNACGQARNPFENCEFPGCPRVCALDVKICPDGTTLSRDPLNNCRFPRCPFQPCTLDILECPDGTFVTRDPKDNCNFPPCPRVDNCQSDIKLCPGYTDYWVSRNPDNNCQFYPCPPPSCPLDVNECGQARDPFSDPPCEFPGCASPCPLPANVYAVLRRHKWNHVCVPWGDTPFASDTSTSSASTFVGTSSGRSDVEFADGGYLETASTTVISTTGEASDTDMIEQYDLAIDWARSDATPVPTDFPTSSPTPGPSPGPNPSASLIASDGGTAAAANMVRYGTSAYQYYSPGNSKVQMANAASGTTYKRLRRRRHRKKGPS